MFFTALATQLAEMGPDNAFRPSSCRPTSSMAVAACHAARYALKFGSTQAPDCKSMARTESWLDRPPGPRGSGVILFGFGVLCLYLGILGPLLSHRAPGYWPHLPLAVAGLPPLVVGLLLVVFGKRAEDSIGEARKPLQWKRWLTIPLMLAGAALFFWLRRQYEAP